MTAAATQTQASLRPTTKSAKVASNRIVFHRGADSYEIPVEYGPINADRLVPLVSELASAMWQRATCEHRRARGERDTGKGVDLGFEEAEALNQFNRVWNRISFFLRGE